MEKFKKKLYLITQFNGVKKRFFIVNIIIQITKIMKKKILSFTLLLSVLIINAQSISAELISSAGNHYQDENIQVSWSIGEPIIATLAEGDLILTQGFHQDRYTIQTLIEDLSSNFKVKIYPNPTTDFINVNFTENSPSAKLQIKLYDFNGKMLLVKDVKTDNEKIDMSKLANSVYILKITDNKKDIFSYKISKIY